MSIVTFNLNDSGSTIKDNLNANFSDLDTTKADLASPTFTGTVTTPAIKITTGAGANKILTSDADGDATWETNTGLITIETGTSATQSLTTTANQKVIVWVKGTGGGGASGTTDTITLAYNGVTKDTAVFQATSNRSQCFALQYTETPGAGTHDITVTGTNGVSNVLIIVMKIG